MKFSKFSLFYISFYIMLLFFATPVVFAEAVVESEEELAAIVNEKEIQLDQVDYSIKGELMRINTQLYEARMRSLNKLIDETLLEQAAEKQGVTLDVLKEQIKQAAEPVTDEQIQEYYDKNKKKIKKEFEQAQDQIRNILVRQSEYKAWMKAIERYRNEGEVEVFIKLPRVEIKIPEDAVTKGAEDGSVTIVEFTDFQCPYCKRNAKTMEKIVKNYPDDVRLIHRDYPLAFHKQAKAAAIAARCANEQGKFWSYRDILFKNQKKLGKEKFLQYANDIGLDEVVFTECIESNRYHELIQEEIKAAQDYGVSGTPAAFVNGRLVGGARPYSAFEAIILEELEENE